MHLSNMNDIRRFHIDLNYARVVQPTFWTHRPAIPEFVVASEEASLEAIFTEYNTLIGDKDYVVLDQLTLADFVLAFELITFVVYKYDYETKQPNLARWLSNLQVKHPMFKEVQVRYMEHLEVMLKIAEEVRAK